MPANEPDENIHLDEGDAGEAAVPAAGGTFGVTDENSAYGATGDTHPDQQVDDSAVAADERIQRARPVLPETEAEPATVEAVVRDGNRRQLGLSGARAAAVRPRPGTRRRNTGDARQRGIRARH